MSQEEAQTQQSVISRIVAHHSNPCRICERFQVGRTRTLNIGVVLLIFSLPANAYPLNHTAQTEEHTNM
jgi:hypothetical protein